MFERLDEKLKAALAAVQKPGRYTGGEPGCVYKEKEKLDLRFAFCFPDTYEVGMSYLGYQILYALIRQYDFADAERAYRQRCAQIDEDRQFLRRINGGCEAMPPEEQERVRNISARYSWVNPQGETVDFLSDNELENLTIRAGTLTSAERDIINHHIDATIKMLESLPWPKHLKHVPEFAGGHHERMDGNGYPKGLQREEMSVQARIMGIADIFEALTARDRPYKPAMKISEALRIMNRLAQTGHIDPDLFDVFQRKEIYLRYAEQYLEFPQIDVSR